MKTPDGGELTLHQRGDEFSIRIDGREVMNSRMHDSEDALATLACQRISSRERARVLVGGLGMGFTLAAALAQLGPRAEAVVAELVPAVVAWNRGHLHDVAGQALEDRRTRVHEGDVAEVLRGEPAGFDAVLLDVDHSPDSLIQKGNAWLYTSKGLSTARAALRPRGVLAVWSVGADDGFTRRLRRSGFEVDAHRVRARDKRGAWRHIWVATRA